MKKLVFSIVFIAGMQFVSQAQTKEQDNPKKAEQNEQVNPDGTLAKPAEVKTTETEPQKEKKADVAPEGSRSAITEKGVPATKTNDKKKKTNSSSGTPKIGRD